MKTKKSLVTLKQRTMQYVNTIKNNMKAREIKRMISYLNTGIVLRENASILGMLPGILPTAKKFDDMLLSLITYTFKQGENTKSVTKEKENIKKKMVALAVHFSNAGRVYAYQENNFELLEFFTQSFTKVIRRHETEIAAKCRMIHTKLTEVTEPLKNYGVRKKDLTALNELIDGFEQLRPKTRTAIVRRSVATQFIEKELNTAGDILTKQMDGALLLYGMYPAFCASYKKSRSQKDVKCSKTILENTIKTFYLAPVMPKGKVTRVKKEYMVVSK